jgi:hypothetical protein
MQTATAEAQAPILEQSLVGSSTLGLGLSRALVLATFLPLHRYAAAVTIRAEGREFP